MSRRPYPSELSEAEWEVLEPLIPDAAMTILRVDVSDIIGQAEIGRSKPLRKLGIVKTSSQKQKRAQLRTVHVKP